MAEHKVPQDVEADDKLIGPFNFRQFCYLMVAFGCAGAAFFAGRVAIPLALIPLPIGIFFLVLALPLRKDQPMEIYLAALFKYYFRPRARLWQPDGQESLIQISNPVIDESPRTKELASDEVSRRLSFLANVADTQGWSTRGLDRPVNNTNLNDDFAATAQDETDMLEDDSVLSSKFDKMLDKSDRAAHKAALAKLPPNQRPVTPDLTNVSSLTGQRQQSIHQSLAPASHQASQTSAKLPTNLPNISTLPGTTKANTNNKPAISPQPPRAPLSLASTPAPKVSAAVMPNAALFPVNSDEALAAAKAALAEASAHATPAPTEAPHTPPPVPIVSTNPLYSGGHLQLAEPDRPAITYATPQPRPRQQALAGQPQFNPGATQWNDYMARVNGVPQPSYYAAPVAASQSQINSTQHQPTVVQPLNSTSAYRQPVPASSANASKSAIIDNSNTVAPTAKAKSSAGDSNQFIDIKLR